MKTAPFLSLFAATVVPAMAQEWLDRTGEALAFQVPAVDLRGQLRGTLDLEAYVFDPSAPGLIQSGSSFLFNPRLSLFLDTQFGPHVYVFGQARIDRGFDPSDRDLEARLDEYAIRLSPWTDRSLSVQFGKFATVVGNWVPRHLSWENSFVTAPLVYEGVTAISDFEVPKSRSDFIEGGSIIDYEYNPVIWGADYSTGVAVSGAAGGWEGAVAMKNSALTGRPRSWSATDVGFEHPSVEARIGYSPNPKWHFGVLSGGVGPYFLEEVAGSLPPGRDPWDYAEMVLGQDIAYAWHRIQIWAEIYEARFDVPLSGGADILGGYVEVRYKLTPQLYVAGRWNQQWFGTVPDDAGRQQPWGPDRWRWDTAVGYRFTDHIQFKVQYNLESDISPVREFTHTAAAQLTVRF